MRGHVKGLLGHFSGLSSDLAVRKLDLVQALLQYTSLVLTRLHTHAAVKSCLAPVALIQK